MSKKRLVLVISVTVIVMAFILIAPVIYVPPPPLPHYTSSAIGYSAQPMYYSVSEVMFKVGGCYWSSGGSSYYGVSTVSCPEFLNDYGATNFPCYWIFCV